MIKVFKECWTSPRITSFCIAVVPTSVHWTGHVTSRLCGLRTPLQQHQQTIQSETPNDFLGNFFPTKYYISFWISLTRNGLENSEFSYLNLNGKLFFRKKKQLSLGCEYPNNGQSQRCLTYRFDLFIFICIFIADGLIAFLFSFSSLFYCSMAPFEWMYIVLLSE